MQVPKTTSINNQTSFGAIILRDNKRFSRVLCDDIEAITKGRFESKSLADKRLIDEVIKSDFNTPKLKETFAHLVESQKNNPINIYIDLFTTDKNELPLYPSGWFQKATVGKITFKQATTYFDTPPSPIKFLKRACLYANILKFFRFWK